MIGSSSTGLALRAASLNAIEPATLNAISEESTSCAEPSVSTARTSTVGIAREHAGVERRLDALVDRGDELTRDAAAGDLVDELVAAAGTGRLEVDDDVRELARTTGLLDVAVHDVLRPAS